LVLLQGSSELAAFVAGIAQAHAASVRSVS